MPPARTSGPGITRTSAISVRTSRYSMRCLMVDCGLRIADAPDAIAVRMRCVDAASRSRNADRAGSTPTTSGTDAIGRSPRSQAASRTASFSVVSTIADPAASASIGDAPDVARRERMVIAELDHAADLPADRQDVRDETLRPGDAGDHEHAGPRRHDHRSLAPATLRGAPIARVTRNTGEMPNARPMRSAAVS